MTVLVRGRRNDNVLIGFGVLVAAAIAIRVAVAGNTVPAVIFGLVAVALVALGVWLHRQPARELHVSPTEIAYVVKGRVTQRIGHVESGGRVLLHKQIRDGHAWFDLVDPDRTTTIPLEGFRVPDSGIEAVCAAHGWQVVPSGVTG